MKNIDGNILRKLLISASNNLYNHYPEVDALNVFPVPDGDTGTNMSLTLKSAVAEMNKCESNTIESICVAFNRGALKGARGNSGVITSQIIKGVCSILMSSQNEVSVKDFAKAIQNGADKIRFNPGNIGDDNKLKMLIDECLKYDIPVRIGVNSGSIENEYQRLKEYQYSFLSL